MPSGLRPVVSRQEGKNQMEGLWGPVTSTMNWCEGNYVLVSWIAEFWNALTSLFIALLGVLGWRLHRHHDLGMQLAFIALAVIGFGSFAFHGTLRFETQMMDEIPMIWAFAGGAVICAIISYLT